MNSAGVQLMTGEQNLKVNEKFEEILQRMTRIETKLDNYNGLKRIVYDTANECKNNSTAIKEMRKQKKFINNTIIVALITTSVSAVAMAIINFLKIWGGG
jgi:adenine specific DNA methylase Mod